MTTTTTPVTLMNGISVPDIPAGRRIEFGRVFNNDKSFQTLDLDGLEEPVVMAFITALRGNTSVTALRLSGIPNLSQRNLIALGDFLKKNDTVSVLDFCGSCLGDEGVVHLARALPSNTGLSALILSYCDIGSSGADSLFKALGQNETVKKLILTGNRLNDEGAVAAGTMLKKNQSLRWITLSSNSIGDVGVRGLCDGIRYNSTIQNVWLDGNNIGDKGCEYVGNMLKENRSLKQFGVMLNPFGRRGKSALVDGIRYHFSLVQLDIGDTFLDHQTQPEINFYIMLNRCCYRSILEQDDKMTPTGLWAHVLGRFARNDSRLDKERSASVLYLFVQEKADLLKGAPSVAATVAAARKTVVRRRGQQHQHLHYQTRSLFAGMSTSLKRVRQLYESS